VLGPDVPVEHQGHALVALGASSKPQFHLVLHGRSG
jgi:hypothetical protein